MRLNQIFVKLSPYSGVLEAVLLQVYYKKAILKNMEKFTGKHLCRSRFLADIKRDILTQVFSSEFFRFFTEYFQASPSANLPNSRFRKEHVNSTEFSKVFKREPYFAHQRIKTELLQMFLKIAVVRFSDFIVQIQESILG